MDLLQLQYFRTIARLENLTRAAEQLYVTQPNLSVSITRLEEDLGVSLFDRRRGKIVLTPTGRIFLDYVERVLDELDAGVDAVRGNENASRSRIRVAGSIVDLMGDMLLRYYSEDSEISFKQVDCPNSQVAALVLNDEVDFGFVFGSPIAEGLEYIFMDSCPRVVMLRKEHPLAQKTHMHLSELSGEKMICNNGRDDDIFLNEMARLTGFRPRVFFECDDIHVETNLILAGRGVSIVPVTHYLKLCRQNRDTDLRIVRILDAVPQVQLGMVRRRGGILTDAALRFFGYMDSFFKREYETTQEFLQTLD